MKGTSPRVTHPSATISFDLHVLGLPPAFVLSQNQTLRLRFDPDVFHPEENPDDKLLKAILRFDEKPVQVN